MNLLRRLHPAIALLLLVGALALRLATPAGYMPVADEHGVRVAICSGNGASFVEIDPGLPAKEAPRDPCPYGVAMGGALDVPPVIALPDAPRFDPPAYSGLVAARLTAWHALRPPARGPPTFA